MIDSARGILLPAALRRDLGPWSPWGRMKRRLAVADALLYEEIERRRGEADLEQRTDVLSLLLRARDEDGQPMSDAELRDELITMLAAGHETTATGPGLRVRAPAAQSGGARRGCASELAAGDDAYLDAVVTESLRLRPVIDAAERTLTKRRAGRRLGAAAGIRSTRRSRWFTSRADLYPEPDEFRPERFLEGRAESYSWLPFGGGIRRCIGAALAQAEMAEVIRTVVSSTEPRARSVPSPTRWCYEASRSRPSTGRPYVSPASPSRRGMRRSSPGEQRTKRTHADLDLATTADVGSPQVASTIEGRCRDSRSGGRGTWLACALATISMSLLVASIRERSRTGRTTWW